MAAMMIERIRTDYRLRRKQGERAHVALYSARTEVMFDILAHRGLVRLTLSPDEDIDLTWLDQDHYSKQYRDEQIERVNRDGSWGIIGEFKTREGEWEHADSCWGFIGDDWCDSGYDSDIKTATIKALWDRVMQTECPTCEGKGTI